LRDKKKPFILGLTKREPDIKHLHCAQHPGARLIPFPEEEGWYQCPQGCGPIPPAEVASDTKITSRFGVTKGKQIASGHNRSYREKQYYDKAGHKINPKDPDIMADIARGATIEYYHTTEDLNPKEPARHVVRR
jgi:hypothetical protein